MDIIVRELMDTDRQTCLQIEAAALPGVQYVNDVWEDFTCEENGYFLGATRDGTLAGIGKITRLQDGYGWLETLRVHPDYQGRGLGKAIYGEFMRRAEQMQFHALGMYTESWNARSAGLAETFGLRLQGRFTEFILDAGKGGAGEQEGFRALNAQEAENALAPFYQEMGAFLVVNRTYFPVREGLAAHIANEGWLFADENGNIAIAGFRFQPQKALHLAFFHGDTQKIMLFVNSRAKQLGSARISAMRAHRDQGEHRRLQALGFSHTGEEFLTLWKGLDPGGVAFPKI